MKGFDGKALVDKYSMVSMEIHTPDLILNGRAIPRLFTEKLQQSMKILVDDLVTLTTITSPPSGPVILTAAPNPDEEWCPISFVVHRDDAGPLWKNTFKLKMEADKKNNPMLKWIKDAPEAYQLLTCNIFKSWEQPPLPALGFIIAGKSIWLDSLEMHVHLAYGAASEHELALSKVAAFNAEPYKAAFVEIPHTSFANNKHDNSLTKAYIVIFKWDNIPHDKPKIDEVVQFTLSFDVPACPDYQGPNRKKDYTPGGTI